MCAVTEADTHKDKDKHWNKEGGMSLETLHELGQVPSTLQSSTFNLKLTTNFSS